MRNKKKRRYIDAVQRRNKKTIPAACLVVVTPLSFVFVFLVFVARFARGEKNEKQMRNKRKRRYIDAVQRRNKKTIPVACRAVLDSPIERG